MMRLGLLLVVLGALAVPALAQAAPAPVTWCGTDEVTNDRVPDLEVSAAQQVRVVYAIPSDGTDNFLQMASGIATDAAWIDQWWRTQDPTRTPRFDRYPFPNCPTGFGQLDIGFVRLPNNAAYYAQLDTPSLRLDKDLFTTFPATQKTIVYFDSPIHNQQVCGETDYLSDHDGGGQGIVYIYPQSGCHLTPLGATSSSQVAAHELLHNLGAVPDQAPHECPDSSAHVCDSPTDVMAQYIQPGSTLDQVVLDYNHDDYYAHSGSWWDIQDSDWLEHLPQFQLSLAIDGPGKLLAKAGKNPLACTTGCSALPIDNGTTVSIVAVASPGYRFEGWSGGCGGTAPQCTVAVGGDTTASAAFVKASLRLAVAVSGKGTVKSSPAGIACSASCTNTFGASSVRLTAKPAAGWRFARWSGACTGRGACTVTAPGTVRAVFSRG